MQPGLHQLLLPSRGHVSASLVKWKADGVRGVWFRVDLPHSEHIPVLVRVSIQGESEYQNIHDFFCVCCNIGVWSEHVFVSIKARMLGL